jgi:hypothetical protein
MTKSPLTAIPLAPEVLSRTPPEVIDLLLRLLARVAELEAHVEELETKLNQNSSKSNKPPSSDSFFDLDSFFQKFSKSVGHTVGQICPTTKKGLGFSPKSLKSFGVPRGFELDT